MCWPPSSPVVIVVASLFRRSRVQYEDNGETGQRRMHGSVRGVACCVNIGALQHPEHVVEAHSDRLDLSDLLRCYDFRHTEEGRRVHFSHCFQRRAGRFRWGSANVGN